MIKATPRPWRVVDFDILAELPDFANTGIVTGVAGRFSDIDGGSVALDRETITANLALIVKAVNAYDNPPEENPLTPDWECGDCSSFDRLDVQRFGSRTYCELGNRKVDAGCVACVKIVNPTLRCDVPYKRDEVTGETTDTRQKTDG